MPTEETVIMTELEAAYALIRRIWKRSLDTVLDLTEQERTTLKAAIEAGER